MSFLISDAFAAEPAQNTTALVTESSEAVQPPYELSQQKMMSDTLVFLLLLFTIFYFVLIRPQQKKLKLHQAMLKGLQKGNKVMTAGGIIGSLVKFEGDDIAIVEIAQGVKVRVARSTITDVVEATAAAETANDN